MSGSEADHQRPLATTAEIAFIQQYEREQLEYLSDPRRSPATNWLKEQGLTNLDMGRLVLALARHAVQIEPGENEATTGLVIPWSSHDEFLNRIEAIESSKSPA